MTEFVLYDYGVGNLHSLRKALQAAGAQATVTEDPARFVDADVAVLPGVGAFGHVMESLAPAAEGLRERHADGRPILGVCIGLQALYEGSAEAPDVPGLGILQGTVDRLPASAGKVPHMGWSPVTVQDGAFTDLDGHHVYYVHSYAAPVDAHTFATSTYGAPFAAGVRNGNTLAFQFHPEKSSTIGRAVLREAVTGLAEAAR